VELQKATAALESINTSIRALEPSAFDKMAPVLKRITALDKSPCFEFDRPEIDQPDSPLALKTFWDNGGYEVRASRLTFGIDGKRTLWSAPSMGTTLSRETHPRSPLLPLLCGIADSGCRAETASWRYRAELAFERFLADKERQASLEMYHDRISGKTKRDPAIDDPFSIKRPGEIDIRTTETEDDGIITFHEVDDCADKARHHAPEQRMNFWLRCRDEGPVYKAALPLGGMHPPQDGWLVLEGRRGHYEFCDEIRAYHMGTSSAYVVQDCSGLALNNDGSVDARKTDDKRTLKLQTGIVSREAIREAAWMILTAEHVDNYAHEANAETVPADFALVVPSDADQIRQQSISWTTSGSTAQTTLRWSYHLGPRKLASGDLTWPYDSNTPEWSHSLDLLHVAESSLQDGCAKAAPPDLFAKRFPSSKAGASERIRRAWNRLVSERPPCND